MPATLSKQLSAKLLGSEWSFGYNCYEVGHTWTPSCTDAALEVSSAAGLKVVPLYAALYLFSQLAVQRRYDLAASWETLKSVGRSSFFIFFHAYNGSVMGCALRRISGRFYYRVLVCAPALLSSYLSLLIEKPARRQALAFYMLNLASEILYRMAVTKGYFRPIRGGETLLFAVSLSAWYYHIKTHGFGHDPVSAAVRALIGRDEAHSRSGRARATTNTCCPHTEASCTHYALSPAATRFALGFALQLLLGLSARPFELLARPGPTLVEAMRRPANLRAGLFLSSLVSAGRATSCALRRLSGADHDWHAAVAGLAAGLAMAWAPRSSLSMYVMWKAVEQYYLDWARHRNQTYFGLTILTIYAGSAATILYAFALEPRFVRPSYMKFLDRLSDHRLHQLNRMVLDVFQTGSSIGYEDFFPDLDPRFMSNQFKELVFNWMIQPYE